MSPQINHHKLMKSVFLKIVGLMVGIGYISVMAGMWLDNRFNSQPFITIGAVILSFPLILGINLRTKMNTLEDIYSEEKSNQGL